MLGNTDSLPINVNDFMIECFLDVVVFTVGVHILPSWKLRDIYLFYFFGQFSQMPFLFTSFLILYYPVTHSTLLCLTVLHCSVLYLSPSLYFTFQT